ncbi:MAG TPA: uroporphyrinogen decarboxylase family protein [Candidatus Lokiarchaeia archaeon]|nr:uroporphyrinogen decarboxylase family protein [Candidatus Lokiarchaeia archaeon]
MDPKSRFLSVFTDDRNNLDRVPLFVQGVLVGFVNKHESQLFDEYEGELIYNTTFDAPLVLGFDAVFAGMPASVSSKAFKVTDDDGQEHLVGLHGQVEKHGTNYYAGGLIKNADILEQLQESMVLVDSSKAIQETLDFYEKVSRLIFPVPMIGGIFDTTWQAMGFTTFAKEYRKNSNFYKDIIKFYANITKINVEKVVEATGGRGCIINILDDVAFKGHPMISPERWAQDIGPYYKEITAIIHDAGMHAICHSDGDITDLVPNLIDTGFQGLQGWEGGANPAVIAEKFPEFVTIGWGDVGNIPFWNDNEIEHHALDILGALKENRHLVMGPSTVIFEKMPIDNIKHFIDCIKKYGVYE